jgi:hypothetical protein
MPLNSIVRRLRRQGGPPERSRPPPDRRSGPPDWVLPGATIDMWFAKSLYFGASPDSLSVVRDTPGYAEDGTGRWIQFGNGVARTRRTDYWSRTAVPMWPFGAAT